MRVISTTTTWEPGCCAARSAKTVELCERMTCGGRAAGKCYFVEGEDADCTFATTRTTEPYGCWRASGYESASFRPTKSARRPRTRQRARSATGASGW